MTDIYYSYDSCSHNLQFVPEFAYKNTGKFKSACVFDSDWIEYLETNNQSDAQKWNNIFSILDEIGAKPDDSIDSCNTWRMPNKITEQEIKTFFKQKHCNLIPFAS